MTLIKSISGIRGTIGGTAGLNLTPPDVVSFVSAFGQMLSEDERNKKIVIGRDGRQSGTQVSNLVIQSLVMMGYDVVDLGLSTTPTVEMEVVEQKASGGIIITASHNPRHWNALKFLNAEGEFINEEEGARLLSLAEKQDFIFADIDDFGEIKSAPGSIERHVEAILGLPYVDARSIRQRKFHVGIDCINSSGAIALPILLDALGCTYFLLNEEVNGRFAHNPEPLEEHLGLLMRKVTEHDAHLGIAVDPDVDRLALVDERGKYCGEEYTLVMVADWVLKMGPGNTVSNLSSTKALKDITEEHGGRYAASPVGEVHVVRKMKEVNAVIGGEGNGGVILPALHYGRDAMVGIALLLTALSKYDVSLSAYRSRFPDYLMQKSKMELTPEVNPEKLFEALKKDFSDYDIDTSDGLKIYLREGWVHIRKSNTEPILRIYSEEKSREGLIAINQILREAIDANL